MLNSLFKLLLTLWLLSQGDARTVRVDIQAPWPVFASSPLIEIAEFFHEQSPDMFWQWVDISCSFRNNNTKSGIERLIEQGDFGKIRELSFDMLTSSDLITMPKELDLIKTSVSMGMYLPAVRFFESVASAFGNPCNSSTFIVAYPEEAILCSMDEVKEYVDVFPERSQLIAKPRAQQSWEHVSSLGASVTASDVHLAVFGMLGTESFCSVHKQMSDGISGAFATAATGSSSDTSIHPNKVSVAYSFRHGFVGNTILPYSDGLTVTNSDSNSATTAADISAGLYGYGVYLDIKNMEYTTVDDGIKGQGDASTDAIASTAAAAGGPHGFPEEEELSGINFHKLYEHYQHHKTSERSLISDDSGDSDNNSDDSEVPKQDEDTEKNEKQKKKGKKSKKKSTIKPAQPLLDTLSTFRKQLISAQEGAGKASGGMKVWNMRDLGLQTVQAIRTTYVKHRSSIHSGGDSSGGDSSSTQPAAESAELELFESPGAKLIKIVQNFPSMAATLSDVKVTKRLRSQIASWRGEGMSGFDREPQAPPSMLLPYNHLFINGLAVSLDTPSFNVFDIIKIVTKEYGQVSALRRLLSKYFNNSAAISLLMTATKQIASLIGTDSKKEGGQVGQQQHQQHNPFSSTDIVRIDVSKGAKYAVAFVNNLEKDAMYKQWPKTLRQLGQPAWNLILVARNLYTCISVIKPLSFAGANLVLQTEALIEGGMPIRFGYVLSCSDRDETVSVWDSAASSGGSGHSRARNGGYGGIQDGIASNMDVCVLYSKLRAEKGQAVAWKFIVGVATEVMTTTSVDVLNDQLGQGYGDDAEADEDEGSMFGGFFGGQGQRQQQRQIAKYTEDASGNIPISYDTVGDLYISAVGGGFSSSAIKKNVIALVSPLNTGNHGDGTEQSQELATASATSIATEYALHSVFATNTSAYIEARGLVVNTFSLNGIVIESPSAKTTGWGAVQDMQSGLMQYIGREQYIMSQAYAMGIITDKTKSLFSAVLEHANAYNRYHPLLFPSTDASGSDDSKVTYVNLVQNNRATEWLRMATFLRSGGDDSPNTNVNAVTSTIIVAVPPDVRGYTSAAAVFQWLDASNSKSNNNSSDGDGDGDDAVRAKVYNTLVSFAMPAEVEEHLSAIVAQMISAASTSSSNGTSMLPLLTQQEQDIVILTYVQRLLASQATLLGYLSPRVMRVVLKYLGRSYDDSFVADEQVVKLLEWEMKEAFTASTLDALEKNTVSVTGDVLEFTADGLIDKLQNELVHLLVHRASTAGSIDIYSDIELIITALENSRQMRSLLADDDHDTPFVPDTVSVVYNARVFTQKIKPLHPLDMEMFAGIEDDRVTHRLHAALTEANSLIVNSDDNSNGSKIANPTASNSQLFTALASFCGRYSSSESGKRFDVRGILSDNELAVNNASFMIEIPAAVSNMDITMTDNEQTVEHVGLVDVVYLFNPLSKAGQRGVSLIPLFESHLHVAQTLVMIPVVEITSFPLQNFYRFVLPFSNNTIQPLKRNAALFQELPTQHTLTVRTDVPESWNVQTHKAVQDIDNLRCTVGGGGTGRVGQCGDPYEPQFNLQHAIHTGSEHDPESEYELDADSSEHGLCPMDRYLLDQDLTRVTYSLKNFIVPGQCFETGLRPRPPAGLQLLLRSDTATASAPAPVSTSKSAVAVNINSTFSSIGNKATAASYQFTEPIVQSDTLVMNNLGYFQLQANPGLWRITLAPGRADALYTIVDNGDEEIHSDVASDHTAVDGDNSFPVVINSFGDSVKRLHVQKRRGRESIGLLDDAAAVYDLDDQQLKNEAKKRASVRRRDRDSDEDTSNRASGMWKSISRLWKQSGGDSKYFSSKTIDSLTTGKDNTNVATTASSGDVNTNTDAGGLMQEVEDDEMIHVFSLATGHMYERLLRIMMLSVTKRTSMKVKFWLFENYLSPTFKNSAEQMSREYGFEVAYVTYKWPSWLTQQSEKQRIIWGYKILFLDVLFPIDVKRIIYVDADQVLRTDLKELWETDLEGKPYGYVPFCSSRNETLGFQFWRSGFWKDHLRGLPYHISALYLVDLENFRKHAVGDILRSTYDG